MAHRKDLSQEMLEHVTRQRESGLTVANYAKQAGITQFKLQYWIRKFNAQEAGKNSLKFIDLSSFDSADHHSKAPELQTGNPQITLTFPNGMCVSAPATPSLVP